MDVILKSVCESPRLMSVLEATRASGGCAETPEVTRIRWPFTAVWRQRFFDNSYGPGSVFVSVTRGYLCKLLGVDDYRPYYFGGRIVSVGLLHCHMCSVDLQLPVPPHLQSDPSRFVTRPELHALLLQDLDNLQQFLLRLIESGKRDEWLLINPKWK